MTRMLCALMVAAGLLGGVGCCACAKQEEPDQTMKWRYDRQEQLVPGSAKIHGDIM